MEEYIKLKDLEELLASLYQEPEYQHTGETYYAGICAVSDAVTDIPTTQIPEADRNDCGFKPGCICRGVAECKHLVRESY